MSRNGSRAARLRIQLWSYNYDPEPSGIGPLATVVARSLADRGHAVEVVAAHPHYPEPRWGTRLVPYREHRDGVGVLRLPIWPGRTTVRARVRQELSFLAPLFAAMPALGRPDVLVAVSPSFPGLSAAMTFSRLRRIPWILWLQDIIPDVALEAGVIDDRRMAAMARRFELAAYTSASRIVVISDSFADNLRAKGVPAAKLARVYNPASRPVRRGPRPSEGIDPGLILSMGNVGHSQNLVEVTRAFEKNPDLRRLGARLTIAGDGVRGDEVRRAITTERATVAGFVDAETLDGYLMRAAVGLVSQRYDGAEGNVPSKLSNFLGYGIPVVAAVPPSSEVASVVDGAGAGWVAGSPADCAAALARALADPAERERRGAAGLEFARREMTPSQAANRIESAISEALNGAAPSNGRPTVGDPPRRVAARIEGSDKS